MESRFGRNAHLSPGALRNSLAIEAVWLADGASEEELAPALYRALQIGRIRDLNTVVAHLSGVESAVARVLRLAELSAASEVREGREFVAMAQMLDVAIFEAARRCSPAAWQEVRKGLALEAMEMVRHWLPRFYGGSFTRSVLDKTMTREQYIQTLSNAHHYVRQTTQHLGRAVANANDRDMRRHLIHHLNGEINHEVMIENDLRHLGVDPEYVTRHRMPNWKTKAFMAVQEAAVGFYHDPLMLMACALAGEAVAAHMPSEFLPCLRELVVSWGVQRPERAVSFIASHTHVDGGEAGHWQATADILGNYLVDEATQRRFLCTVRATAESFERLANSNIDELPLFARVS
ncbi:MAG: iron-containing redox enzyme family protein [Myxococcales bacterium]